MKICFKVYTRIIILSGLILIYSLTAKSQFYETGQDPFSVSWKQINLKHYKLIFPESFEPAAKKFAATLDTFYPVSSKYLLKDHKRIPIVFHTQSSLSNGLVVYAPKRMELYTIPPQDNYPQDWLDQLALHETRHVVQLDALNQGLTRFGSFLIGQQAVGAVSGLVPRWFLEGDAVYSETMFSNAGRGRSAAFQMPYRALVLSDKLYPYEKALLGSYRNFVPDIYQMGYPIVKMMRDSFDQNIFGKSLKYTARNPYLVFPFGRSLKINSGLNNRFSYEFTYKTLGKVWEQHQYSNYQNWPVQKTRTFTNYNTPVKINDSVIIAQKWSLAETRRYVLIDKKGREKKLFTVGSNNSDKISFSGNKITWSENKTDLRWTNRTYSEIMIYDLDSKGKKVLTRKTWYFSPAFSHDGKQIAVIEETPQYKSFLVILDASTGEVLQRTAAPAGNHLQYPVWDLEEVYCLSVQKSGKSIIKLTASQLWEEVMPSSFRNISTFCLSDKNIIFAGEDSGINNIFIYSPSENSYSQVTNSRFGAFEPFMDTNNNHLYFTEYTSDGYRIGYTIWSPDAYLKKPAYNLSAPTAVTLENTGFNIQNIAKDSSSYSNYSSKKYPRLPHLINIHSWLPAYFNYSVSDFSNPGLYPGLMLLSQDVLGTLVSSAGYSYREGFSHFHANISYKALLPVISWNLDVGGPIQYAGSTNSLPLSFNRNIQSTVNISLPLNLSRGKYASGITPWVEWKLNRNAYYIKTENNYYQGLHYINYGVSFYRYTKMAIRDIFPRFGVSSFFKAQTTPFENKLFNEIYAASARLYLPGILNNHSLQLRYAFQKQSPLRYLYGSMISFPAGYTSQRSEELHAANITYALPLVYPDFHLGPVLYMKRIRTHFFYDIASNKYQSKPNIITHDILRSVGTDIIADVHFLRIMFPFQVGARVAYLPEEKSFFSQAIFSVNLVY